MCLCWKQTPHVSFHMCCGLYPPFDVFEKWSSLSVCQEYTDSFGAKILNTLFMQYPLLSE